jgi:hypothetical protein
MNDTPRPHTATMPRIHATSPMSCARAPRLQLSLPRQCRWACAPQVKSRQPAERRSQAGFGQAMHPSTPLSSLGVGGPRGRSHLQRLRAPVVDGEPEPARPAAAAPRSGACRSCGRAAAQRGRHAPAARRSDWREHDLCPAPARAAPRASEGALGSAAQSAAHGGVTGCGAHCILYGGLSPLM